MKTILLTIKLTVLSIFLSAQVTFIPHELNIDTLKPWIITCGDLDGDNHEDILFEVIEHLQQNKEISKSQEEANKIVKYIEEEVEV